MEQCFPRGLDTNEQSGSDGKRGDYAGCVFTLVRAEDLRHFRALLQKIDGSTPSSLELDKQVVKQQKPVAAEALMLVQGLA